MKSSPETDQSSVSTAVAGDSPDPKPTEGATGGSQPSVRPVWQLVAVAIVGVVVGAIAVAFVGRPRLHTPGERVAPAATAPPSTTRQPRSRANSAAAISKAESVAAPKWTGSGRPQWMSDGSRMVAFELPAENSIPVWQHRVRPTLTVRCLSGTTDVFVSSGWAASVETADRHTVRLGFDADDEILQEWLDSEDYKALFAPDGVAMARRLARARTLRFGFTPFNTSPVVVDFDVRGLDAKIGSVARLCRWKP